VLVVEVRRAAVGDEELAAVGAWPAVGHAQDATPTAVQAPATNSIQNAEQHPHMSAQQRNLVGMQCKGLSC
jgi:hypothetical protein